MSRKIIGVTVGSPLPKPNLKQNDPTKGDYVKGKDIIPTKVSQLENDAGFLKGSFVASTEPPEDTSLLWIDLNDNSGDDVYTAAEIDAMFGAYVTDIDTLVGGDG